MWFYGEGVSSDSLGVRTAVEDVDANDPTPRAGGAEAALEAVVGS